MSHADFVHLRVRTTYSLLEGAIRLDDLVETCRDVAACRPAPSPIAATCSAHWPSRRRAVRPACSRSWAAISRSARAPINPASKDRAVHPGSCCLPRTRPATAI